MMRVLLVAPTASKKFGGEAILPVHWFRTLREIGVDVELLTHARVRDELAELFPDDLDRIHFVEDTWLHRWLDAPSRWLPRRLHEVSFAMALDLATQYDLRRVARQLIVEQDVDVIHVPTPVSPRAPSVLSFSVPTVFGPMNGGMAYPPAFSHRDSRVTKWVVKLGRMAAFWSNLVFRGKRNADLLLVANERSRQSLPRSLRNVPCEVMVENGVETAIWGSGGRSKADEAKRSGVARLITIGRLVDCKAIDQLLHALAGLNGNRPNEHALSDNTPSDSMRVHLDIIGDGPQRLPLEELTKQLGLSDHVTFHGFLSQDACCRHLEEADIFLLPSLHECGGAAVLESMACGIPVIAANWGGPADYLTGNGDQENGLRNYGLLVEPTQDYVRGLQDAILELISDPSKGRRLAEMAKQHVHEAFDWTVKGQQMLDTYERVIKQR